jgi:hypothetical protein
MSLLEAYRDSTATGWKSTHCVYFDCIRIQIWYHYLSTRLIMTDLLSFQLKVNVSAA